MGSSSPAQHVQYSDCAHFSLDAQRCHHCGRTACGNCFGFPLSARAGSVAEVELAEVCRGCFVGGTQIVPGEWWEVLGQGNGKEVLFLHAEGYSRGMFRSHAAELTAKGYRCLLVDLPGHGGLIAEEFSLRNCLRVIGQALSLHCSSSPVAAVGCSFGALALLEYLAAHESAFCKVVLLSCCSRPYSAFELISPSESRIEQARKLLLQANRESLKAGIFLGVLEGGLCPLRFRERRQFIQKLRTFQSLQKNNGYVPVLLINGEQEDRKYEQQFFSVAGKHSHLLVYKSTDHLFWCEETRYFGLLNDITYFLNRE